MAVRIADTLKQQNDLTSFPVAYAEGIWVNVGRDGADEFKTLQELYALGALGSGGSASSAFELKFVEDTAELTLTLKA